MTDVQITLTAQERDQLIDLLEVVLKETKVEEHRTRAPSFREIILEKEHAIVSLLRKLGKPVA